MQPARILVVDDTKEIHADLRRVLAPQAKSEVLATLVLEFASSTRAHVATEAALEIESAYQGAEALALVERAQAEERPFSMAFVDMRMPPGWDGVETIERLWAVAPDLQVVICTAYSDQGWSEIHRRLGRSDQVLILKKPFEAIEARQAAWALVEKWHQTRASRRRLLELEETNRQLRLEVDRRTLAEQRLLHDALHDVLTDLPNRALISNRIERSLAQAKRDADYRFALLFIDLDDFKVVNDSLGHRAGDRLLIEISNRLLGCTRSLDCAQRLIDNTAGRLGGDEFVVLLDGLREAGDAEYVAQRIIESLSEPLLVDGHELRPMASIGIAHGSVEYEDATAILRDADTALYRAKCSGKNTFAVFDAEMRKEALARLRVESELRQAIRDEQLFLQYQPIMDLRTCRIRGFEALVRWRHPEQGVLTAAEFVPLAEETGLVLALGEWVLQEACQQTRRWRSQIPAAAHLFVNVNFSTKQFMARNFVERLRQVLDESGLDQSDLNIELTESLLMQTSAHTARVMQQLREGALNLHIDDFGTGFSSLAFLHELPVSAIKLDKSFLRGLTGDPAYAATVRAVIEMAHARKLRVVAEGIETPEQLSLLQSLGCDLGQGYYFSRPVDAALVDRMLASETVLTRAG